MYQSLHDYIYVNTLRLSGIHLFQSFERQQVIAESGLMLKLGIRHILFNYHVEQLFITDSHRRTSIVNTIYSQYHLKVIFTMRTGKLSKKFSFISEIIRELVERIIVHKVKKVDGRKVQHITIQYNDIGVIVLPPSEDEKTHSRSSRLCRIFQGLFLVLPKQAPSG